MFTLSSSSSTLPSSLMTITSNFYPIVHDLDNHDYEHDGDDNEFNKNTKSYEFKNGNRSLSLNTLHSSTSSKQQQKHKQHRRRATATTTGTSTSSNDDSVVIPDVLPTFQEVYIVTRQISKGNRSTICECIHRKTGIHYCVKMFDMTNEDNKNEINMILSPQTVIMDHENIIQVREMLMDYRLVEQYDFNISQWNNNNNGRTNLSKSNSIMLTPICNSGGKIYMVMNYMEGGNLLSYTFHKQQQQLKPGSNDYDNSNCYLEESLVQKITVQLLCGLQHLHEECYTQLGNLHPANILLTHKGDGSSHDNINVRLTDFGSAFCMRYPTHYYGSNNNNNNNGNVSSSSPTPKITNTLIKLYPSSSNVRRYGVDLAYIAPEFSSPDKKIITTHQKQLSKQQSYTDDNTKDNDMLFLSTVAASDMWSLGAVVYFMLTGRSPDVNIKKGNINNIVFPSHLSRHAKQFLCICFQLDPSIRMTASEALQHLWLAATYQEIQQRKVQQSSTSEQPRHPASSNTKPVPTVIKQQQKESRRHRRNPTYINTLSCSKSGVNSCSGNLLSEFSVNNSNICCRTGYSMKQYFQYLTGSSKQRTTSTNDDDCEKSEGLDDTSVSTIMTEYSTTSIHSPTTTGAAIKKNTIIYASKLSQQCRSVSSTTTCSLSVDDGNNTTFHSHHRRNCSSPS